MAIACFPPGMTAPFGGVNPVSYHTANDNVRYRLARRETIDLRHGDGLRTTRDLVGSPDNTGVGTLREGTGRVSIPAEPARTLALRSHRPQLPALTARHPPAPAWASGTKPRTPCEPLRHADAERREGSPVQSAAGSPTRTASARTARTPAARPSAREPSTGGACSSPVQSLALPSRHPSAARPERARVALCRSRTTHEDACPVTSSQHTRC